MGRSVERSASIERRGKGLFQNFFVGGGVVQHQVVCFGQILQRAIVCNEDVFVVAFTRLSVVADFLAALSQFFGLGSRENVTGQVADELAVDSGALLLAAMSQHAGSPYGCPSVESNQRNAFAGQRLGNVPSNRLWDSHCDGIRH